MNLRPYGDFKGLIFSQDLYHGDRRRRIPQAALWSIFNNLVEAFPPLEYGDAKAKSRQEDWYPIVHRDVKLDVVFLDRLDPNSDFLA